MTKQEEGKLWSKFTRWPSSWIWAFQVSRRPQLLCVSLTIVYACQDHVLESLKMAFFVVILDSKYSKMTPKFVKQKSHWLHSSIKFTANVQYFSSNLYFGIKCSCHNVHLYFLYWVLKTTVTTMATRAEGDLPVEVEINFKAWPP